MTQDEALKMLQTANSFITLLNPLLGGAISLGTMIVHDLRSQGATIGPFGEEIAKFDAETGKGIAADDAWRARHGVPPAGTQQGPSAGSSTSGIPSDPMKTPNP